MMPKRPKVWCLVYHNFGPHIGIRYTAYKQSTAEEVCRYRSSIVPTEDKIISWGTRQEMEALQKVTQDT